MARTSNILRRRNLRHEPRERQKMESVPMHFDNFGNIPIHVPGVNGETIDAGIDEGDTYTPRFRRFRHGVNDFHAKRMTVKEVAMLQLMDSITDKPNWNVKILDDEIAAKWGAEAQAAPSGLITEKAWEWCLLELRDRAETFEEDGFVRTFENGSRVVKSDSIITPNLRDELRKAVQPLLDVKEEKKDYHPNSNKQVLNLVHPSLYPLVYGKTRVLHTGQVGLMNCMDSCGKGELTKGDQSVNTTAQPRRVWQGERVRWSNKFQWLPCEVRFQEDEELQVKITSYINNLPPQHHSDLYHVVAKFITKAIPLWDEVLFKEDAWQGVAPLRIEAYAPEIEPSEQPAWFNDIPWNENPNEEQMKQIREYMALPESSTLIPEEGEEGPPDDWEDWEDEEWNPSQLLDWKFKRTREITHPDPDPEEFEKFTITRSDKPVSLQELFGESGLQVIVKLSSIELTPDNPKYAGGSWHLEGMMNEHIVATAIYYYDVENVTPSSLAFRQEAWLDEMSLQYEQDDHQPLQILFGTNSMRNEAAVQNLGAVTTPADRFLIFPNTLQHKVAPFELADPTKHGHRRFLVLWLVDPHYRICSTANVPPQQVDWWRDPAMKTGWNRRLPQEVTDMIMEEATAGTMSHEDALAHRLELMKERTTFQDTVEGNFEEYNLCEH